MATILVIDDDDAVRALLRQILDLEGYRVIEVSNGRAASSASPKKTST